MFLKRIVTATAAVALVAGAGLAVSAPAQAAKLGETELRLTPAVTTSAQAKNVSIYVTTPGVSNVSSTGRLTFAFPITGIEKGKVQHWKGSILIAHNYEGSQRTLEMRRLLIDAKDRTITARVFFNGADQGRMAVFTSTGGQASGSALKGVKVDLAAGIASGANMALGTDFFVEQMRMGTASGALIN